LNENLSPAILATANSISELVESTLKESEPF